MLALWRVRSPRPPLGDVLRSYRCVRRTLGLHVPKDLFLIFQDKRCLDQATQYLSLETPRKVLVIIGSWGISEITFSTLFAGLK